MLIRGLEFPDDLLYHAAHMVWLRAEGNDVFALGLTALAPATAGEILLFVPKAQGWAIERDRSVGNVETGKLVSAVRTPVAGVLLEVNHRLELGAIELNRDPYGHWLVRIQATDWGRDRLNLVSGDALRAAVLVEMDGIGFEGH
jgi:glycine cleavage system H protein